MALDPYWEEYYRSVNIEVCKKWSEANTIDERQKRFWQEEFIEPGLLCERHIKMLSLLDRAKYILTGYYGSGDEDSGRIQGLLADIKLMLGKGI